MIKFDFTKFTKNIKASMIQHSPEILTGLGVTGMLSATVMAVKATPTALSLIEAEENARGERLNTVDTVKVAWKCYIPTGITTALSIGCIIGANSESNKRNAALMAAYQMSESAIREYRDKVVECIGKEKEEEIRDTVIKEKIERTPIQNTEVVIVGDNNSNSLFYDTISKRYFMSSINKVDAIVNTLNYQMNNGDSCISLNEFYYEVGLPETKNNLGWQVSRGLIEVRYSGQITEDGRSCIALDFTNPPMYNYDRLY